tara:strand:+ start:536 stop:742 length:207 start_codon:yes stop_codon:yes gene_type:complete
MALSNTEVLENLTKQKEDLEKNLQEGQNQMETLRQTYLKVVGAIDALTQIEESNNPTETSETEVVEGE